MNNNFIGGAELASTLSRYVRLGSSSHQIEEDDAIWQQSAIIENVCLADGLPDIPPCRVVPSPKGALPDQIWEVLTNRRFRRGSRAVIEKHREAILQPVRAAIRRGEPIEIVLPTIPFKDQNPTTTGQSIDTVDLGEYAFVAQLRDICLSVQNIYEPGVRLQLVADGQVYSFLARGETEKIINYRRNVERLLGAYSLAQTVKVTDFRDIVADDESFAETLQANQQLLKTGWDLPEAIPYLRRLQEGMLVNIAMDDFTISDIEKFRGQMPEEWPGEVEFATRLAATEYAAFLITAGANNILGETYPSSVRATVHPKDAPQLPLHTTTSSSCIAPYNGVPVIREGDLSVRQTLRIERLATVLGRQAVFLRYHDDKDNMVYFAEIR